MASESSNVIPVGRQEAGNQVNAEGMEIVTFDQLVEKYKDDEVRRIAQAGPHDSDSRTFLVDFSRLAVAFLDNMESLFSDRDLRNFTHMVSKLSNKYSDNPILVQQISDWCYFRKKMIKTTNSAANELDQNLVTVYLARILGSFVEILTSFGVLQELCSFATPYASDIAPSYGFMIEMALKLVPNLRYMGIVCCFFENLRSEIIVNRVVAAMKKDRDMFIPLKEWFDETDEFEDSVKKLLPYEIDKEDIGNVEAALQDLKEEQKIFAATFISNIKKQPELYKDGKFLTKVFLFCRSEAAKEWYKRMLKGDRPSDEETAMVYFRTELQELERINVDSGSTIEIGKLSVQASTLPRLVLLCMNGMSIYHCLKQLQSGSKHRYSDDLRQLAKNSQSFLNKMDKIRIRYQ